MSVWCVNEDNQTGSVSAASPQRLTRWLFVCILGHSELMSGNSSLTSVSSTSNPNFRLLVQQAQLRHSRVCRGAREYTRCIAVWRHVFVSFSGLMLRCFK